MVRPRRGGRARRPGIVLLLAALTTAWAGVSPAAGAGSQEEDSRPQAEEQTGALVEELGRALGMTPAEIEALEQGPDISAILAIALRQVEVLRDGAAAQYGSDAIAGVLNFQLRDARGGGSVEVIGLRPGAMRLRSSPPATRT